MRFFAKRNTDARENFDFNSPRMRDATFVVKAIITSQTPTQLLTAGKLLDLFENKYGRFLPIHEWYLQQQFNVYQTHRLCACGYC